MSQQTIDVTLSGVRQDIEKARRKRANLMNAGQFEKDGVPTYVVRSNIVRAIAKTHYKSVKSLEKAVILDACENLFELPPREANSVALDWSVRQRRAYAPTDLRRFERWLKEYVNNWGMCDGLGCGPIGFLLHDYPELAPKTRQWAKSKNIWFRRAAAVALIPLVRNGQSFELATEIADRLLLDKEDYVQKGYGWLLKEASHEFQAEVFAFVMSRRDRMPRTALRYAIEKMPQEMRHKAMQKA
jgi:3-methyladenine DNA glycosylase AlkD